MLALALVTWLEVTSGLTGAVDVLEPPLHPVRYRTAADVTVIMPMREPVSWARNRPASLPVRDIELFSAAVAVLLADCVCITTSFDL